MVRSRAQARRLEPWKQAHELASILRDAMLRMAPQDEGPRGASPRARRSLMASPRPSLGTGITAMEATPAASSARRCANRLAAASIRSPRAGGLGTGGGFLAPGGEPLPDRRRA